MVQLSTVLTSVLAVAATTVHALHDFANTASLVLVSNTFDPSESFKQALDNSEWSYSSVFNALNDGLSQTACPYDAYIIVQKSYIDDSEAHENSASFLETWLPGKYSKTYRSLLVDSANPQSQLISQIANQTRHCGLERISSTYPADSHKLLNVISLDSPESLSFVDIQIEEALSSENFLLIYIESNNEKLSSLKSVTVPLSTIAKKNTDTSLFARYQFFGPGVFMTLIMGLLFIIILLIAQSWLSSLQISYRAFEGPSGQEKTLTN